MAADSTFSSNAEEAVDDKKPSREGTSEGAVSEGVVEDDIEMGEVEEDPKERAKNRLRELEEGEATDASSELSEPPDD